jgi:hypothetical protein
VHERGNYYLDILAVLGIPRSTCNDIVQKFDVRGDSRPQMLDERVIERL